MRITTIRGKTLNLQIFQGALMCQELPSELEFVREIHLKSGEVYPGLVGYTEEVEKVLIPLSEKTYAKVEKWFDFHTTEEALACNWNEVTE